MSKTARQILTDARAYLTDPAHWHQGGFANAAKVCALGGLRRSAELPLVNNIDITWSAQEAYIKAIRYLRQAIRAQSEVSLDYPDVIAYHPDVPDWNDDPRRTHQEILDGFDRAIALAEADEIPAVVQPSDAPSTPDSEMIPFELPIPTQERELVGV